MIVTLDTSAPHLVMTAQCVMLASMPTQRKQGARCVVLASLVTRLAGMKKRSARIVLRARIRLHQAGLHNAINALKANIKQKRDEYFVTHVLLGHTKT